MPPNNINEIVHGKRAVTADTAIRLALALGTFEQFWMGLQSDFDLEEAKKPPGKSSTRSSTWPPEFPLPRYSAIGYFHSTTLPGVTNT